MNLRLQITLSRKLYSGLQDVTVAVQCVVFPTSVPGVPMSTNQQAACRVLAAESRQHSHSRLQAGVKVGECCCC